MLFIFREILLCRVQTFPSRLARAELDRASKILQRALSICGHSKYEMRKRFEGVGRLRIEGHSLYVAFPCVIQVVLVIPRLSSSRDSRSSRRRQSVQFVDATR